MTTEDVIKRERIKKINEILEIEEGIAMASEVLMTISKDEVERARLMSEYKYQLDNQSKLVHAKREGQKEEREKWQGVVAEKDATIAEKDTALAEKDALIAKLLLAQSGNS